MTLKNLKTHRDYCNIYISLSMLLFLVSIIFQWYSPERGGAFIENITYPILMMGVGIITVKGVYQQHPILKLAVVFVLWYALTRIFNGNSYLMHARYGLVANVGCWLVALPFGFALSGKQKSVALNIVAIITLAFVALISWLSLYAVLFNSPIHLPFASLPIGINEEFRLSALGKHPNLLGCILGVCILLAFFITGQWKNRALAVIVNLVLCFGFYCADALTDSRTSLVLTAVFTSCAIGISIASKLAIKKHIVKNIFISALIVVCSIVLYLGNDIAKNIVNTNIRSAGSKVQIADIQRTDENTAIHLSSTQTNLAARNPRAIIIASAAGSDAAPMNSAVATAPVQIIDRSLLENASTLNGRLDIYIAVIRSMWDRPISILIGADEAKFMDFANKYLPAYYYHAHNSLLQVFAVTGIVGLIIALFLLMYLTKSGLKVLRSHESTTSDKVLVLIPAMVFMHAMMEGYLFLTGDILNLFFFLTTGLVIKRAQDLEQGYPASSLQS